jgi:hypothetical protein
MNPKQKIKDLIEKGDIDDKIVAVIDDLMSFRHQQLSEIMNMPVLLVEKIMERINKEKEEMRKASKK